MTEKYVLIIEDSATDAFIAERVIRYVCPTIPIKLASDGVNALDVIKNQRSKPSLIFLDINMPKMGGIEFLNKLSWSEEEIEKNVIVLSSSENVSDKFQCQSFGVSKFILKPISVEKCKTEFRDANILICD